MQRKVWKNHGKKALSRNFWKCFVVSFVVTLLTGGTILLQVRDNTNIRITESLPMNAIEGKTNSDIVNEFVNGVSEESAVLTERDGVIGNVLNNVSRSGSFLFGFLNAINQFLFHDQIVAGIIIIIGAILSILYWIFLAKVLEVSRCRFFLENKSYPKTKISRILLPFRVRKNFHVAMVMLQRSVYQILWMFTVIGGPIKLYSYRLVPYLLAENPTLKGKDALSLSSQMMNGHKWEAFLFDCSFLLWYFLGFLTLNLVNLFYTNLYVEASFAEYYMSIRSDYFDHNQVSYFCRDVYLEDSKGLSEYPEEKYFLEEHDSRKFLHQFNYERKYSFTSYILLFFAFSMLGWIWEVCLTLFSDGIFVNRGALFGPWLPIYGSGGVLILFLLQRVRKYPGVLFLLTMFICGIIEYGTALYLETFKHLKWWDYTGYFLNIHGRICLEGLLFFGIGGLFFVYILAPYFDNFFQKWNQSFIRVLCILLVSLITLDFMYSSKHPNTGEGITSELVEKDINS